MDFLQAFGRCYVVGDEVVGHGFFFFRGWCARACC